MATTPTGEEILEGMYTVLNSLQVIHELGCSKDVAYCDTLTYRFSQLAHVLAAQLAAYCSALADYLEEKERMP